MDALDLYLSGTDTFCSVCLRNSTEARLMRTNDVEFFTTVQVNQMTPYMCAWCVAKLRSFHDMKSRALRSQYWLYNLHHAGYYEYVVDSNKQRILLELEQIKDNHLSTVVQPVTLIAPSSSVVDHRVMRETEEDYIVIKMERKQQVAQSHEAMNKLDIDTCYDWQEEPASPAEDETSALHMLAEASSIQETFGGLGYKRRRPLDKTAAGRKSTKLRKSRYSENMRRTGKITETDKKVILDELDDVGYMLSDLMAAKIQPLMLTEEQYWTLHAEKMKKAQYLNVPHKCVKCALAFHLKDAYDAHMKKHQPKASHAVRCVLCDTHYRSQTELVVHRSTHLRRYRCGACGHASYNRQDCTNHYFAEHTAVKFHCRYCGVQTKGPFLVKEHIHSKHKIRPKDSEECGICKKQISQRNKYRHAKSHEIHTPLQCTVCGNTLKNEWSLKHHINKFHTGKQDLLEECPVCKKTVTSSNMAAHVKRHTHLEVCSLCFKTFNNKSALQVHAKRMHTKKLSFQCDYCGKTYSNKASVRRHIMFVHMGVPGVHCRVCGKAFSHLGELNMHVRRIHEKHLIPRDKLCDFCGKGFTTAKILENHRLIHTGEKPHTCSDCGQTFRQHSAMRTHIKLKHLKMKMKDIVSMRKQKAAERAGANFPGAKEWYLLPHTAD